MRDDLAVLGGAPVVAQPAVWPERGEREQRLLTEVATSGHWAFNGPMQERFEHEFGRFQGLDHVRAVTNGTIALQLAYEALDLGPGDEVIVPGLTWQATASAVLDVNAVPVLVDVEQETWCIDPDAVALAITERTRAIVAVHLYCSMPDLARLRQIADAAGVVLIEDCAHAHGAKRAGTGAGAFGMLSTFSFQSSKTLTSGEGGAVATRSPVLADRLDSLRNCGRPATNAVSGAAPVHGGNHRITEWQAAVLRAQLERFPEQRERREHVVDAWLTTLADVDYLDAVPVPADVEHQPGYGFATSVRTEHLTGVEPAAFRRALSAELGVPVESCYQPLDDSPFYRPLTKRSYRLSDVQAAEADPSRFKLPNAWRVHEHSAVIPHHALLRRGAADHLAAALKKIEANLDLLRAASDS